MGCDIHFHVEKRTETGAWERAEAMVKNRYYVWTDKDGRDHIDPDEPELVREDWYHDRNYALFGMLADVRNGIGFAGFDTGDPVVPIAEPRDLPIDVCEEVRKLSDYRGADGHSHSWLTAAELLAVDWQQKIVFRGWVSPEHFDEYRKRGRPESWCGGVSGGSVRHVSNDEMAHLIDTFEVPTTWNRIEYRKRHGPPENDPTELYASHTYTRIQWAETWARAASEKWLATMLRMARLALAECGGDLNRVRCVFWFDN